MQSITTLARHCHTKSSNFVNELHHFLYQAASNTETDNEGTGNTAEDAQPDDGDDTEVERFWMKHFFSNEPYVVGKEDDSPVNSEDEDVSY